MSEEEKELRRVLSDIIKLLRIYVDRLKEADPSSREGARLADSITKLLGRVKDFEDRLTEEESDVVMQLSKMKKKAVKYSDNVSAAVEYLRLALRELGGLS